MNPVGADPPSAVVVFSEDFENANTAGWVIDGVGGSGLEGFWEFGDPHGTVDPGTGAQAQPEDAFAGSGCAFTAQNTSLGSQDVDDGTVRLMTPPLDLAGAVSAELRYARWFFNRNLGDDPGDGFTVSARAGPTLPWEELEHLDDSQTANTWQFMTFDLGAMVALTSTVQVRFEATDRGYPFLGDVIEAAVDGVVIEATFDCQWNNDCLPGFFCDAQGTCQSYGDGDLDTDGDVDLVDYFMFQECFGQPATGGCLPANLTGDSLVDLADLEAFSPLIDGPA